MADTSQKEKELELLELEEEELNLLQQRQEFNGDASLQQAADQRAAELDVQDKELRRQELEKANAQIDPSTILTESEIAKSSGFFREPLPSETLSVDISSTIPGETNLFGLARSTASQVGGTIGGVSGALTLKSPQGMMGGAILGGAAGRYAVNQIADTLDSWLVGKTAADQRDLQNEFIAGGTEGMIGLAAEAVPIPGSNKAISAFRKQESLLKARQQVREALVGTTKRFLNQASSKGDINAGGTAQSVTDLIDLGYKPLEDFKSAGDLFEKVATDIGYRGERSALNPKNQDLNISDFDNIARKVQDEVSLLPEADNFRVGREIGSVIDKASELENQSIGKATLKEVDALLASEQKRLTSDYEDPATKKSIEKKFKELRNNFRQFGSEKPVRPKETVERDIIAVDKQISKLQDITAAQEPGLISPEFLEIGRLQKVKSNLISEIEGVNPTFSIRDLQNFKVKSSQIATSKAFDLPEATRAATKRVHVSVSNALNKLIDARVEAVDNAMGTHLSGVLSEKKALFSALKDFVPIANELNILEQTGKLTERAIVPRFKGPASGNVVSMTGGGLGGAVGTAVGGGYGAAIGAAGGVFIGNRIANKKLASRLMRINTALSGLKSAKSEGSLNLLGSIGKPVVRGAAVNITGRRIDKLEQGLEGVSDAVFLSLSQSNGLINSSGEPSEDLTEDMLSEIDSQTDQALSELTQAIIYGDKEDVSIAMSGLAKSFPDAFPKSKSGIKGEVIVDGISRLPMIEDRAKYSQIVADDPNLTDAQKAKMRSAVHKDGTIIDKPK